MGALEAIKAAVVLVVGAALGWVVAGLYGDLVSLPAAREAGRIEERMIQAGKIREAEARAAAERQAAQAKIDAIETGYIQREAERSAQLVALEQALQEKPDDPPPIGSGACRVLIPGRVSDQLNRTGRAPTPAHPGQSDGSLPPGR